MTYATLATVASLLEKEKNIREKECELLREKFNAARDKAEDALEDEELSHVAEFARALYEKARKGLLNHERAYEDFLEHDFR